MVYSLYLSKKIKHLSKIKVLLFLLIVICIFIKNKKINAMRTYSISKPSVWKRHYEIINENGREIGHISWGGIFTTRVEAVGSFGKYYFKTNTWGTSILILDNREVEIARIKMSSWNNEAIFAYKGQRFYFKKLHWASSAYIWENDTGQKLISFKPSFWGEHAGSIRVYDLYQEEESFQDFVFQDLMMALGYYMLLIKAQMQGS